MSLPTSKTPPSLSVEGGKFLIYGDAGIGKTTLTTGIDRDHTILIATEPGYGGIEAFVNPVNEWAEFLQVVQELREETHPFKVAVVDTVDELQVMCQRHVMQAAGIEHPSDLEWGKGWDLLSREWRRVAAICNLGMGVYFVSHKKEETIEQRVGSITKAAPALAGKAGDFLLGFVDFAFLATTMEHPEKGEVRCLRTHPSANWVAKTRLPGIQDPLPLDPKAMRQAINKARKKLDDSLAPAPKPVPVPA